MKNNLKYYVVNIFIILCLFSLGCEDSPTEPETQMVDGGSWYETGFTPWPHDGKPLESENFVIYSDGASLEARKLLAEICEEVFTTITVKLGITDLSVLKYPAGRNNKIHIYAYYNYNPTSWGGQSYYGGYLIYSPDHPIRTGWGQTKLENYVPLVRHEMMHVVQTLILGKNDENSIDNWFGEGLAIEISNDATYSEDLFYVKIDTKAEFDNLISTYGQNNPILKYSSQMPTNDPAIGKLYYYPMYWLAFRYLIDPAGSGGSFNEVREVLFDGSRGVSFETSMKNRFGISSSELRNQFFDLMHEYLK